MHKILILTPLADNLHPVPTPVLALPDHRVMTLEGPDAVAFAHAQFANDVLALDAGHWHWNAWLTPKGRVIALFALARLDEDRLLAVLPDYPADVFASQLQRYVFRRKLKVSARQDLHVNGALDLSPHANGSRLGIEGDGVTFDLQAGDTPRFWRVEPRQAPQSEAFVAQWRALDLRHGVPRLPESQWEQWTPQQIALDRLNAYSIKKGCYPGQEIVARTHFLGKAKRSLRLLQTPQPVEVGAPVQADGVAPGTIVSTAETGDGSLALAVVALDATAEHWTSGAISLAETPLLPAPAR